jgi:hypothetical protein
MGQLNLIGAMGRWDAAGCFDAVCGNSFLVVWGAVLAEVSGQGQRLAT